MTVHAYIADLVRELRTVRRQNGPAQDVNAITGVCGVWERGAEFRCFGLRRLATIWPLAGHNVDCPACRAEVRRLLGERTDPEREARVAALAAWVAQNPDGSKTDTLKAEAQRRRCETQRRKARARRAANPLCACGRKKAAEKAICGAEACALRRAIEVRRGARRTA